MSLLPIESPDQTTCVINRALPPVIKPHDQINNDIPRKHIDVADAVLESSGADS